MRVARRAVALAERLSAQGTERPCEPVLRRQAASSWFTAVASADAGKASKVLKLAEAYADSSYPDTSPPFALSGTVAG
jgi:hypothetical protein